MMEINNYLAGPQGMKIVSVGLMLLSLILFLFIIIVLYIKSIAELIKGDEGNRSDNSVEAEEPDEIISDLNSNAELERELEIILAKEMEHARVEKESKKIFAEKANQENLLKLEKDAKTEKEKKENNLIDLDWKKGKTQELENLQANMSESNMIYQKEAYSLSELTGLIIDMLARGVHENKIAQTINFRNQGKEAEEDILQTIHAVQNFIALCMDGKFKKLHSEKKLPDIDEALFHLAKGDASLALTLIEAKMDNDIEISLNLSSEDKREKIYDCVSNYAMTFGNLAKLSDYSLATKAYELAVELNPRNYRAWSRIGDIYYQLDSLQNAADAYNRVLSATNDEFDAEIRANAKIKMSYYLQEQGKKLEAAKMYNEGQQYFANLGINQRLEKQEIEILEIIESRKNDDIESMVAKLVAAKQKMQYTYST